MLSASAHLLYIARFLSRLISLPTLRYDTLEPSQISTHLLCIAQFLLTSGGMICCSNLWINPACCVAAYLEV
jgi:hypothetical protein